MKIIDRIEINYFRSIYTETISNVNHVNVFIGNNDVGKSNILKALNLFFNSEPDLDAEFEFLSDLSRLRETEARSAKGRATIWIRVTFNNFLKWKSLPSKFSVKRTWNRYEYNPSDTYPKNVHSVTIAKFLNRISYHYVPAIRGRDIFTHYLGSLHDALIEDEKAGVRESTDNLVHSINRSTIDMSERILEKLNFSSTIKIPEDLKEIFEVLDFSTTFGDYNIPLQRRGDGIQARHIPFILDFIARHSNKYHIWGYEEPENSLEMGKAFEMADQFQNEFSDENQIFITTHSPAFYDMREQNVAKWLVQSENAGPNDQAVTTVEPISASEIADERLGVAPLIASRARELVERNSRLQQSVAELEKTISLANRAQVVVEGPTDVMIFRAAVDKLFPGDETFCDFVSANGATNVAAFIKTLSHLHSEYRHPVVGLVDNDTAGRTAIHQFRSYRHYSETNFRTVSIPKHIYAGALPVPAELLEIENILTPTGGIPLCIEYMFPPAIINEAIEEGVLKLKDRFADARDGELKLEINLSNSVEGIFPEKFKYFARKVDDNTKHGFAQWVLDKDAVAFEYFREITELLKRVATDV